MYLRCLFVSSIMLLLSASLMAQETDSFITVKKSMLPAHVVEQVQQQQKIESYGKWVGLGKEVGTAVKEGLGALTTETDRFSKTGVGKFTMFIIAFKVLGYPILQLFFGTIFWFFGTIITLIFFIKYILPKKVLVSDTKAEGKKWELHKPLANDSDSGTGGAMAIIALCYLIWCMFCCAVIFIH